MGESSGSESRGTASSIFDADETGACRRLRVENAGLITLLSSETSSTVLDDLTFADSQTKQEIELDLAKYPSLELYVQDIII